MMYFGDCPRCHSEIPKQRIEESMTICAACGWSDEGLSQKMDKTAQKKFNVLAILISTIILGGFIQLVQWNGYFFEIIPLKTKQVTGMATPADLLRVAEICKDRQNPSCVEKAYSQVVQKDPKNLEAWAAYGNILINNQKDKLALRSFGNYFKQGGRDIKVAFSYAKLLGEQGLIEEAKEYFNYIIQSKPDKLQITVTKRFVDMLYNAGQYKEAKKAIVAFRKRGVNAKYFMGSKLKEIQSILVKQRRVSNRRFRFSKS